MSAVDKQANGRAHGLVLYVAIWNDCYSLISEQPSAWRRFQLVPSLRVAVSLLWRENDEIRLLNQLNGTLFPPSVNRIRRTRFPDLLSIHEPQRIKLNFRLPAYLFLITHPMKSRAGVALVFRLRTRV